MSCGTSCPCQFNWPLDTHGSKRDTISSEKAWLDFAVRYLSRGAAGKGNGQETVWSERCKPAWWDSEVKLPWKNPTTNPKDNKDILLRKYEALEKHLRVENRFPVDLEEEATLWAQGKYKELFLLCNLTCLLGKVTGVHSAIVEACNKADKMQAQINQTVLKNIRTCLNSALKAIDNFKREETPKVLKRPRNEGKENTESAPCKKLKKTPDTEKRFVHILPKLENKSVTHVWPNSPNASNVTASATKSEDILEYANRILEKRKNTVGQGKIALAEKLLKSYHTKCSEPIVTDTSKPEVVSYLHNSSPSTSPLSLEMLEPQSSSNPDPVSMCSSISSPTSFNAELSDEIDFLLSPAASSEILNDSCPYVHDLGLPNLSDLAHEENNTTKYLLLEHNVLNTASNDIYTTTNVENQVEVDVPVLCLDSNPSPGSISSETHSCPQTSDGGYISADDLNLDFDNILVNEEEQCPLWDAKGSYSLERFLFDNADPNSSTGADVLLLDQWDDMDCVVGI